MKARITEYVVPLVSTCHITEKDCEHLTFESNLLVFECAYDLEAGFFLHIEETGEEDIPDYYSESFRKLFKWAQGNGYSFIRLDGGGDQIEGEGLDINNW